LKTQEEQAIAKPWLETPIDLGKVKRTTNKFIALFSDNDPFVDVRNAKHFEEKLDAKTTIQHNKGHFSGGLDKCFELPFVVEELLKIAE
jgi:predicted alpha/beta hydrolase family esterase